MGLCKECHDKEHLIATQWWRNQPEGFRVWCVLIQKKEENMI